MTTSSPTPHKPRLASVAALIAERRTHTAAWANNPTRQRLRFARCCYGHLAGKLPKALLALEVTPLGRKHLAGLLPSVNGL